MAQIANETRACGKIYPESDSEKANVVQENNWHENINQITKDDKANAVKKRENRRKGSPGHDFIQPPSQQYHSQTERHNIFLKDGFIWYQALL